jgi:hypothetical protein
LRKIRDVCDLDSSSFENTVEVKTKEPSETLYFKNYAAEAVTESVKYMYRRWTMNGLSLTMGQALLQYLIATRRQV